MYSTSRTSLNFHCVKCWRRPIRSLSSSMKSAQDQIPVYQYASDSNNSKGLNSRSVFTWGFTSTGALGNERFSELEKRKHQNYAKPHKVKFFAGMKIYDVAAGYGFTVVAASAKDTEHKLFGTGLNTSSQIGYHRDQKTGEPLKALLKPVPIQLPLNSSKSFVKKVTCGRAHTIVLTSNEQTFSLGNNSFGQCGRPFVDKEEFFPNFKVHLIEGIDEKIEEIVCGQDHTLFLTNNGRVYSCGWGADGQTGLGHYSNQGIPKLVQGDIQGEKIVRMASSADAVLALNDKGDVFGWGNSEYSQFSAVTEQMQLNIPRRLPFKNISKRIVDIACGGTMCGLLDESGTVYVWGFGILGKGPNVDHLTLPTPLPVQLFGANEINTDIKIQSIKAGLSHFAAITNKGDLFMWGRNRQGCLGLSHREDQYFPFRASVLLPAIIKKVSLGVDHTVGMAEHLL